MATTQPNLLNWDWGPLTAPNARHWMRETIAGDSAVTRRFRPFNQRIPTGPQCRRGMALARALHSPRRGRARAPAVQSGIGQWEWRNANGATATDEAQGKRG